MRHNLTWKAGSPIGTIQPLGPMEEPTTFHGIWKDRFVGGGQGRLPYVVAAGFDYSVLLAQDLVRAMLDLTRSGNLIRVQWGPFVRTGIMASFKAEPERLQDIAWEVEFVWNSFDDQEPAPASIQNKPVVALKEKQNLMDDQLAFEPPNLNEDFSASLLAGIANLRDKAGVVFDKVRAVNNAIATPAQVIGSVSTAVADIVSEAEDEIARLLDVPGDLVRSLDRLVDLLPFELWRRDQSSAIHAFRSSAQLTEAGLREEASPGSIGVVTMPAGVTLRSLAASIYGTPDAWKLIASANGLTGSDPAPGTQLIIPSVPAGKGVRTDGNLSTERGGSAQGTC